MKKILLSGIIAAVLVASASPGFAMVFGTYTAGTGVSKSPHNIVKYLTRLSPPQPTTTSQVCIFCHTPHNSPGTGEAGYNPLWNHRMDNTAGFIPYDGYDLNDPMYQAGTPEEDGSTLDAVIDPADVLRGPSRLCMSCHDGNSAIDAYTQNGAGNNNSIPAKSLWEKGGEMVIAGNVNDTGAPADFLGSGTQDLRNDHPIGFNYDDVVDGTNGATQDLKIRISSTNVPALIPGKTSIGMIKDVLYKGKYMTCATCHDVHNTDGTKVAGGSMAKAFLRVNNEGSSLCLMCHDK